MALNLGRPQGPRLRTLGVEQQKRLDSWLVAAMVTPPRRNDDVLLDYSRALGQLARRRGLHVVFEGRDGCKPLQVVLDRNIPGCVGGSHRKVRVRDQWV